MTNSNLFKDLGLSETSLKAINRKGFEEATEIQAMTIPVMLRDDTNIIAQAQTGTGKTAALSTSPLNKVSQPVERSVIWTEYSRLSRFWKTGPVLCMKAEVLGSSWKNHSKEYPMVTWSTPSNTPAARAPSNGNAQFVNGDN